MGPLAPSVPSEGSVLVIAGKLKEWGAPNGSVSTGGLTFCFPRLRFPGDRQE